MGIRVEIKGDLTKEFYKEVQKISKDLYDEIRDVTPVKTGDLHDGWSLRNTGKGRALIKNPQPYASIIDKGHKGPSRNSRGTFAKGGMVRPSVKAIQKNIERGRSKMRKGK